MRVLVFGGSGFLGSRLPRGGRVAWRFASRGEFLDPNGALGEEDRSFDAVLNLAAVSTIAGCERDPARADLVNRELPTKWAARFSRSGVPFFQLSTDLVFDGEGAPYGACAPPRPMSVYGRTKERVEEELRAIPGAVVIRLPLLFGFHHPCFLTQVAASLREGRNVDAFTDEFRTPLSAGRAVRGILSLLETPPRERPGESLLQMAGAERLGREEMIRRTAALAGWDPSGVRACTRESKGLAASRPRDVSLVECDFFRGKTGGAGFDEMVLEELSASREFA